MQAPPVWPRRLSFRTLVLLGTLALVLGAMALLGAMLGYQAKKIAGDFSRALLGQKLQYVETRVGVLLDGVERQARVCAQFTPAGGLSRADFTAVFGRLAAAFAQQPELSYIGYAVAETGEYAMLERLAAGEYRFVEYVILADATRVRRVYRPGPEGFVLVETQPWAGYDPRVRPFYLAAQAAHGPVWTEAYLFPGNDRRVEVPGVTYAMPQFAPDGRLCGVWDVDLDTVSLSAFLKALAEESAGYAFVVEERAGGERMVIAHPDLSVASDDSRQAGGGAMALRDPVARAFLDSIGGNFGKLPGRQGNRFRSGGEAYLTAYEALPSGGRPRWLVAVVMPEKLTQAGLMVSRRWALGLGAVVLVITVLLAVWLARRLARPVERLRAAVDGFTGEAGQDKVNEEGPDELARLASAFNTMVAAVDARRRELLAANLRLQEEVRTRRLREAELEAVFGNAPVEMWAVDTGGRYTLQSNALRERIGDCVGRRPEELALPAEVKEHYSRNNRRALAGEVLHGETAEVRPGGLAHYHWIVAPVTINGLVTGALGIGLDVTERRRAEDALLQSQQRLRIHLENTPLAVIDWSVEFTVLSWNPAAEAMFGWKAAEVLGRNGLFFVPETERPTVRQTWSELLQQRGGRRGYNKNLTRDGRCIDCEWYNTVLTGEDGRVIGVSSLVLDVSQRVNAEALFRESEERFLMAFQASPVAKAIVRRDDGRLIDVNEHFLRLLDCRRDEVIGRTSLELGFWPSAAHRDRFLGDLRRDGEIRDLEQRIHPKRGAPIDVLLSASAVPLGEELCLLVTLVDITERKVAEDSLRENQRFLAVLVSQLPGMVYRGRDDGERTMLFVSDRARELTGYTPAELEHNRTIAYGSLIHADDRAQVHEEIRVASATTGRRTYSQEYRLTRRDGEVRWVWERGECQRGRRGGQVSLVGFITDVTERRRTEEEVLMLNLSLERRVEERTRELAAANEKLKELDRLKSEFLATMSHELRTPLNSIIGFSTILQRGRAGALNPEQQRQIDMVNTSARHLLTLINDLLDLARIESGRVELQLEDFNLADVLHEVESTLLPMVAHKKIAYATRPCESVCTLHQDRKRVFQIVLNLANNAVKFTEQGGVTVACRTADGEVCIEVRDTGIGIKPEHLPQLFEAFHQVDGSARRVYEGTGLGLHLCRKLLALLGGRIEVQSTHRRGSCFTVFLPRISPPGSGST